MTPFTVAPLARVRAMIANAMVLAGERVADGGALAPGPIVLLPGQHETLCRVRNALHEFGGVLVANHVGSGKTFVALAAARAYDKPLVLAPAALRTMWGGAMRQAECAMPFVSIESLGRDVRHRAATISSSLTKRTICETPPHAPIARRTRSRIQRRLCC